MGLVALALGACSPALPDAAPGEALAPIQTPADTPAALPTPDYRAQIVTLLPRDAIRSIDHPTFYRAAEADAEYGPDEMVLGVVFDGEARAYSTSLLSTHEIVNDDIAGRPIAVTW
jgi:hypothetical protein